MPLDIFTDSYQLYKAHTESVLSWLTDEGSKRNVRLPRREATASMASAGTSYIIDVNDIVPYARLVVKASKAPAPSDKLQSLRSAITSRRRYTTWYQGQSINNTSLIQSNKSHEYFTDVLDELFDVLAYSYGEGDAKTSGERFEEIKGTLGSMPTKHNPYDILELEHLDLAGQYKDHTIEEIKASPILSQPPATYQFQDSRDDVLFATFEMVADLHAIRRHLQECLEQYRTRNLSLVSVSAIINCAIGIVRGIEKRFMDSVPHFTNWEKVMDTIAFPTQFEKLFTAPFVFSETAHLCIMYGLPFEELRYFRELLRMEKVLGRLNGHVSVLRVEATQIENEGNWKADTIILHEFFLEILSYGLDSSLPSEDELTRGIREVFKDNPIHLWVVFGLQIFLDIQRILGEEVTRPFREFKATCDIFRENTEGQIKFSEGIRLKRYDQAQKDRIRNDSVVLNENIAEDVFMLQRSLHSVLGPGRPFFFLSHNPVVCGLMQCATLLKSQKWGTSIVNKSNDAAAAAHLYNAMRNEGYLPSRWPDMEKLIDLYGSSDIFLGAPPKTVAAYIKHNLVARGSSITNFAKNKRGEIDFSEKGVRLLKVPEIMKTFEKFLCQKRKDRTDMNVDLMEKVLLQTAHRQNTQKEQETDKKGSSDVLSPVQLLILLEQRMAEEQPKLVFDYFNLNRSCWMLLLAVYKEIREEFTAYLPQEFRGVNRNIMLHTLPTFIFIQFAMEGGKKDAGKENILSRVGRVMDAYISEKAQNPSPTIDGVVDDSELITETEHGTQRHGNGPEECIHWGVCDRM